MHTAGTCLLSVLPIEICVPSLFYPAIVLSWLVGWQAEEGCTKQLLPGGGLPVYTPISYDLLVRLPWPYPHRYLKPGPTACVQPRTLTGLPHLLPNCAQAVSVT